MNGPSWALAAWCLVAGCGGGGDLCATNCHWQEMCNPQSADPMCVTKCKTGTRYMRPEFTSAMADCIAKLDCAASSSQCYDMVKAALPQRSVDDEFATVCLQKQTMCTGSFSTGCLISWQFVESEVKVAEACFAGACGAVDSCLTTAFGG